MLDCFTLPFPREGRDGVAACDRVYAEKGFHELVFVELHLQAVHD